MAGLNDPWEYKDFWHQYDGQYDNEEEIQFWDDQAAEYFAIYGMKVKYYPIEVDLDEADIIFGEQTTRSYGTVKHITGILEGLQMEENLFYNTFGQLNQVEFNMFVHRPTFFQVIGRKPQPGDQFTFVDDITTMVFEVNHLNESTIGTEGNFFGHRSSYILTAREREISQSVAGGGENYGPTDLQGNLLPDAPEDALVGDGSGRIREKYAVPGMQNIEGSIRGDNDAIQEIADGVDEDGEDTMPGGQGIISRSGEDKPDWGDW